MHYVADGGGNEYDGSGSIDDPWNLYTVMRGARILPGDTIYIREGIYTGNWDFTKDGTGSAHITVGAYSGERVRVDGYLTISGDYVDWIGTEHYDSSYMDRSSGNGTGGIDLVGNYSSIKNCVIHDFPQGVTTSSTAEGCEVLGCVVYHCGWDDNLGHGLYLQNEGPIRKRVMGCIVGDNFGYNFHLWGSAGLLNDFLIEDNIVFNAGGPESSAHYYTNILIGGTPLANPEIYNNSSWFTERGDKDGGVGIQVGYGVGNPVTNALILDNSCGGGTDGGQIDAVSLRLVECVPTGMWGNILCGENDGFVPGAYPDNTYNDNAGDIPDMVKLYANEASNDRAHVAIYNAQAKANIVSVDVSSLFSDGDTILIRNAQDYWVDTQEIVVSAGNITIDMQAVNRTVATPQGWVAPPTTFPNFGCFVLERQ